MANIPKIDFRATITPKKAGDPGVLGNNDANNIMQPLHKTNGVLFPYTPVIQNSFSADYEESAFIHSNYKQHSYQRSYPSEITITAEFTAQTTDEAKYLLATIYFFRSVSKSYFGEQSAGDNGKAGLPPPILHFNYLGANLYNKVPVLVSTFTHELMNDIDYVPVQGPYGANDITYVPAKMTMNIVLLIQPNPLVTKKEFNLDDFRQGKMMGGGTGNGGYI